VPELWTLGVVAHDGHIEHHELGITHRSDGAGISLQDIVSSLVGLGGYLHVVCSLVHGFCYFILQAPAMWPPPISSVPDILDDLVFGDDIACGRSSFFPSATTRCTYFAYHFARLGVFIRHSQFHSFDSRLFYFARI